MTSRAANRRGVALMLVAMGCYALNDTFVKLTTDHLPPGQILAVRGAVASALVVAVAWRDWNGWRHLGRPVVGVRCALEVTTALASVIALSLVPLALVTSLMMTAPLLITAVAMALRWEPWQGRRVLAVVLGFLGALFAVRPSPHLEVPLAGIVFALLCAISLAARDLTTRRIPPSVSTRTLAAMTTLAATLAGGLLGLTEQWAPLAGRHLTALSAAALCAAAGNYALIAACRGVDLSVVTPFRYSIIGWAMLLGYVVWGDIPDLPSVGGIAMVAAAGAYAVFTGQTRRP
ncbi:DMT family transporter [Variovorax paradoxus]|uniref:DMT family transporter n=1 Tax=Variovorax paradoxus TaxID=34073 RepID=UPI003D65C197